MNQFARAMKTILNSFWHCGNKLYHYVNSGDLVSRYVIISALSLLLFILFAVFAVDRKDLQQSQTPIIDNKNIDNNMGDMILSGDDEHDVPEMRDYETVDLFKPTQIPIIGQDTAENDENNNDDIGNNKIKFDQWYTISSIDWTNIGIRRMVK